MSYVYTIFRRPPPPLPGHFSGFIPTPKIFFAYILVCIRKPHIEIAACTRLDRVVRGDFSSTWLVPRQRDPPPLEHLHLERPRASQSRRSIRQAFAAQIHFFPQLSAKNVKEKGNVCSKDGKLTSSWASIFFSLFRVLPIIGRSNVFSYTFFSFNERGVEAWKVGGALFRTPRSAPSVGRTVGSVSELSSQYTQCPYDHGGVCITQVLILSV